MWRETDKDCDEQRVWRPQRPVLISILGRLAISIHRYPKDVNINSENMSSEDAANDTGATSDESDYSTEEVWVDVQYYDREAAILAPNFDGQKNVAALLWTKSLDAQGRKIWLVKIAAEKARKADNAKSQNLDKETRRARERAAVVQTSLLERTLEVSREQNPSSQQLAHLKALEYSWRIAMEECDDVMIEREDLWISARADR
jgi:hypothetical protein